MVTLKDSAVLEFLPDTLTSIRKTYNLEGDRLKQSVDIFDEWIKKQNHFVKKDFDRSYLERIIITSKGSVEKAKKQIDRLCTLRNLVPKFFITSDIRETFGDFVEIANICPLPKMSKSYQRIFLANILNKELTADFLFNYNRYLLVLSEYLKAYDYSDGFITIIDLRECNLLDMMKKLNPIDAQQIITIMVEGYGARLQGIHILSRSKVIELLLNTIKPLLSQKISSRFHVYQENEDLYSIVDKDILPVEYGGKERSMRELHKLWLDELSSKKFETYLAEMKEMRTNEAFRQADKFNEQCIGLPGSFRTLSVD